VAADYGVLRDNLRYFYDFTDKIVLYVGAGGRQLLDPQTRTRKLIAIDQDAESLKELHARVREEGITGVDVVASRFENVTARGDVVYFEFCLHEVADPERALRQAQSLAPEIVVFDHLPGSEWVFHAAEEEKVARSDAAMERFGIRRREKFSTEQRFQDYTELLEKLRTQGELAIERAQPFTGQTRIVIPMLYGLSLL